MRLNKLFLCMLLVALPVATSAADLFKPTGGAQTPVEIVASSLEYQRDKGLYVATGDVELKDGPRILKAQRVTYNETNGDVFAQGNVVYQDPDQSVYSETLSLNVVTKQGVIEKGRIFVKQGNFYIRGDQIQKTGETTYVIQQGEFTTCGWDDPVPWKFTARDVDITVEGNATTRGTRFKVWDYTLLYLPWGMFPVKTERQSGLLLPELILSSRDGVIAKDSYFWAIDKDKDATFGLEWIQDRGVKPGAQLRYALTEDTRGTWYGSIIDDSKYKHTRWELKGRHEQILFKDLAFKADVNHVSDFNYLVDFGDRSAERSENSLRSTLFFEKPFPKSQLSAEMTYFETLVQKDNNPTFQYLPMVSFFTEFIPVLKDRLFADVSTEFINYYRTQGERFTRLGIEPKLRFPFNWNGINLLTTGSFRERGYVINGGGEQDAGSTKWRETIKIETDANVKFWRDYDTSLFGLGTMRSLVVPRLRYTYIPARSFRDVPSIDPSDQLLKTNALTYSFNHYLNGINGAVRELALLEVAQTYGLTSNLSPSELYDGSGNRFSDVTGRFTLTPWPYVSLAHQSVFNVYGQGLLSTSNTVSLSDPARYNFNLTYSYGKGATDEIFLDVGGRSKLFDAVFQYRYSIADHDWVDTRFEVIYHPNCWALILSFTQTRRPKDTRFGISVDIAGLTRR